MKLLNDILKVNDKEKDGGEKYSQSRIYLLISVISMLTVLTYSIIIDDTAVEMVENATTTLFSMILIFGGYSLTGKGLATFKK